MTLKSKHGEKLVFFSEIVFSVSEPSVMRLIQRFGGFVVHRSLNTHTERSTEV